MNKFFTLFFDTIIYSSTFLFYFIVVFTLFSVEIVLFPISMIINVVKKGDK